MSCRLTRLLSVSLICVGFALSAYAATAPSHSRHHAKTAEAEKGPTLIWKGDVATARAVVSDVSLAWHKAGHGTIAQESFNTASGLDAVATGTADLAGSARGSDGDAQETNLTFTPVAWDALVIVTQASNPVRNLTLKQVHDIYYGKITNWGDVGGTSAPMDVYAVASPHDGVEYSLRQLLFGNGNQPVAAPRLYVNMDKLVEGVSLNPNGVGVATLAVVAGNSKVKAVSIDGVAPTTASIGNGTYPLYAPLYLVTNAHSPKATDVNAFIAFQETDAAKAALRLHGVLPYSDGASLVGSDGSRRSKILAEVGAHASHISATAPPVPTTASLAAHAAVAAAAPSAVIAGKAAARSVASDKTQLNGVGGGVEGVRITSFAHVKGSVLPSRVAKKGEAHNKTHNEAKVVQTAAKAPVTKAASKTVKTYTVAKGDTLFSIAHKHSVEVAQLRDWNHLQGNNVKLGQALRVSGR